MKTCVICLRNSEQTRLFSQFDRLLCSSCKTAFYRRLEKFINFINDEFRNVEEITDLALKLTPEKIYSLLIQFAIRKRHKCSEIKISLAGKLTNYCQICRFVKSLFALKKIPDISNSPAIRQSSRLRLIFSEVKANFLFFLDKFAAEVDKKENRNENKWEFDANVKTEAIDSDSAENSTQKFVDPVSSLKVENFKGESSRKTEASNNLLSISQNMHKSPNSDQQRWQIVPNSPNSPNSSSNQIPWQAHHLRAQHPPFTPIFKLPFTSQYTFANSLQWLTLSETVVKFFSNQSSANAINAETEMLRGVGKNTISKTNSHRYHFFVNRVFTNPPFTVDRDRTRKGQYSVRSQCLRETGSRTSVQNDYAHV